MNELPPVAIAETARGAVAQFKTEALDTSVTDGLCTSSVASIGAVHPKLFATFSVYVCVPVGAAAEVVVETVLKLAGVSASRNPGPKAEAIVNPAVGEIVAVELCPAQTALGENEAVIVPPGT